MDSDSYKFSDVERLSNVKDPSRLESALLQIDNAEESKKTALWVEALVYHERIYKYAGAHNVFLAMRHRAYRIPTADTPDAAILWGTLLRYSQLVVPVLNHAVQIYEETREIHPHLYEMCMVHWLPRHPRLALDYHHLLVVKLRLRKLPLHRLAQRTRSKLTSRAINGLMEIYRTSNERDLYDEVVPALCDQGHITLARRWHTMCFHRKDLPSPAAASHPIIQLFIAEFSFSSGSDKTSLVAQHQGTIAKHVLMTGPNTNRRDLRQKYNQELTRRLTGRDTAPMRFDDPFCARLFATKAFSPASIIQGLVMVGVNEIGPQAIRAMGLRTDPTEMPERFKELKDAGIALQGCVFSLALEKFALEGRFTLVRSILDSDQHPDVFSDAELQRKLLDFYIEQGDLMQAHRTLAILALFHNDSSTESWNILLQSRIRQIFPTEIVNVLQDMRKHGIFVSTESISTIKSLLRRRQIGRKPVSSTGRRFDDVRFVARIYILVSEYGIGNIYPRAWREIIRRFGMLGRFRELRRLLFWLLSWYAPQGAASFDKLPRSPYWDSAISRLRQEYPEYFQYFNVSPKLPQGSHRHPIYQLIPPPLQQALVIWGFRASLLPNASWEQSMLSSIAAKKHYRRRFIQKRLLSPIPWSIGLQTLVELRDLGVHVHHSTVTTALRMQFIVLFGKGRSNKIANRIMEDVNTMSYEQYVQEANNIWGSRLLLEPQLFSQSSLHSRAWHPRVRRVENTRTWLELDEIEGTESDEHMDGGSETVGSIVQPTPSRQTTHETSSTQDSDSNGTGP